VVGFTFFRWYVLSLCLLGQIDRRNAMKNRHSVCCAGLCTLDKMNDASVRC